MMIATVWQQMPCVRLIIPLLAGIIIGDYFAINLYYSLILLGLTLIANFASHLFLNKFRFEPIHGLQHNFMTLMLGICLISQQKEVRFQNHFSQQNIKFLLVQTETKPKQTFQRISFETRIIAAQNELKEWTPLNGKLQISLPKDSLGLLLANGDQILIKSNYQEISLPKNPGEFNYKAFMARKGIFHQQFLTPSDWKLYAKDSAFSLLKKVDNWQSNISKILALYLTSAAEIGISEALLFGLDDHIPDELIQAYSKTGTLHVLAVSGMHVGLIFLILGWISKPFKRKKWGRNAEPYFLLLGIWAYALLCGLSPSILRASIMFSFMTVGKIINRSGNPINSLAASAFFLLCTNPQMLWHAGFQLSYAAVLGIICFYPMLYQSIYFGNKLLNEIWKVSAVSLAAQVLTFPISLFYFHQFPNYFLVANLLLIPLTTLLIYLGIMLLILHKFTLLATALAWLISKCLALANFLVNYIAQLPFSIIDQVYFPFSYLVFCYALIICLSIYIWHKNAFALKLVLLVISIGFGLNLSQNFWKKNTASITIYSNAQKLLMSYTTQNQGWVFLNQESDKNLKIIQAHFVSQDIKLRQITSLDTTNCLIELSPKLNVLFLHKTPKKWPQQATVLILGKGAWLPSPAILNSMKVQQVLILPEIPYKQRKKIQELCKNASRLCYDIASQGAYHFNTIQTP